MYLSDCLTLYVPLREGLRSSFDTTRLIIPRSRRLIGDRSFSVRGPKLWNVTPHHIRLSSTVATFKNNLKTYLYFCLFVILAHHIYLLSYILFNIIAVLICLFVKRDDHIFLESRYIKASFIYLSVNTTIIKMF